MARVRVGLEGSWAIPGSANDPKHITLMRSHHRMIVEASVVHDTVAGYVDSWYMRVDCNNFIPFPFLFGLAGPYQATVALFSS